MNNLLVIYVRNFKFKEHIDDVFILQTSKEMIPLGLEFPASLGGEDGFFDRANYYMQQGMLRLLANMHKSNKTLNPVYSSVHHL